MKGFKKQRGFISIGDPPEPENPTSWPENGWFLTGGYQISNMNQMLEEPWASYNAEKDLVIMQSFTPDYDWTRTMATEATKNQKRINPNIKVLGYTSPGEARKVEFASTGPSIADYNRRFIRGSLGHLDWFMKDPDGNPVEGLFSNQYQRINYGGTNFTPNNVDGDRHDVAYWKEYYRLLNIPNTEGVLNDWWDGLYFDVVPPKSQKVLVYADPPLDPRVSSAQDLDENGQGDILDDETIGVEGDESSWGDCRKYRRGIINWVDSFRDIFGPDKVIFRNGTRDLLDYSSDTLGDSLYSMSQSEFYEYWDSGMQENIMRQVGIEKNNSTLEYDILFNQFDHFSKGCQRRKQCAKSEEDHIWGRFGRHSLVTQFNMIDPSIIPGGVWREKDYNMARFIWGCCRLNGTMLGLNINNLYPFPMMDEDVFPVGDTLDGNPPSAVGTYDPNAVIAPDDGDWTSKPYNYEIGDAKFYWQEYYTKDGANKYICVVRSDYKKDNVHGYGTTAQCQLPNPGAGKKWVHIDVTTTVNNGVRFTKAQDTNLNDGSDVEVGGSYGAVSLLPAHAVMLVTTDS